MGPMSTAEETERGRTRAAPAHPTAQPGPLIDALHFLLLSGEFGAVFGWFSSSYQFLPRKLGQNRQKSG